MMRMSDQINELAEALSKAQGAIDDAAKQSLNPHFRSRYADLAAVREAIRLPLSQNGLAYTQGLRSEQGRLQIETMLMHRSGQFLSDTLDVPLGKQDAQAIGSAASYGRRYALMAIIGIAAAEDDDDGNHATASAGQGVVRRSPQTQAIVDRKPAAPQERDESEVRLEGILLKRIADENTLKGIAALMDETDFKRDLDLLSEGARNAVREAGRAKYKRLRDNLAQATGKPVQEPAD